MFGEFFDKHFVYNLLTYKLQDWSTFDPVFLLFISPCVTNPLRKKSITLATNSDQNATQCLFAILELDGKFQRGDS